MASFGERIKREREMRGVSLEEIAESMGLNANTVKVRLFRARRRIIEYSRREKKE